ncbi:cytidylate kinase [Candidatus Woesearchaeota archaeon]|jgi:cytidylate kinase|nr:cytidylate kinase [Candidatus Woesearchaeota archaeon]|tara:strand:- start:152 stop:691 length:540 start_codon:yes stop_codon:yes gene_type:complete
MIITISGMAGSGKSTVAKILAKKLDFKHYSIGDMRRKMALSKRITLSELNKVGEKKFFTDKEVDEFQSTLAKKEDDFVIDGRLSYHFIPLSFKVFLNAELKERAKRVLKDNRREEKFIDIENAKNELIQRKKSDIKRYEQYYDINPFKEKGYDLVIDTTNLSVEEVVKKILKNIGKFRN